MSTKYFVIPRECECGFEFAMEFLATNLLLNMNVDADNIIWKCHKCERNIKMTNKAINGKSTYCTTIIHE